METEAQATQETEEGTKWERTKTWAGSRLESKKNWAVTRQIPGYGTLQGELPPQEKNKWFERGSVWGLLVFLGSEYTGYIILSFNMCLSPFFGQMDIDGHFSCKVGEQYLKTYSASVACEYLKSYVWIFPMVVGTTMLLLVGRELVHKRFYYYLLNHGGVLSFMAPPPLRDIIMIGNFFVFSQFWLFVLFVSAILYTHGVDPIVAADRAARASAAAAANPSVPSYRTWSEYAETPDKEDLALLIHLLIFLGIPGIFVTVKLWGAYDLERTLVPLSEFVRDCSAVGPIEVEDPDLGVGDDDDGGSSVAGSLKLQGLSSLTSLKDNYLKVFLEEKLEGMMTMPKRGERYDAVIKAYPGYIRDHIKEEEPPKLQLCDALWPAAFIMAAPSSIVPWHFQKLWILYRTAVIIMTAGVCIFLVYAATHDVRRAFNEHHQALFRLPGIALSLYLEVLILRAFLNARAFVKHMPLPGSMQGSVAVESIISRVSSID